MRFHGWTLLALLCLFSGLAHAMDFEPLDSTDNGNENLDEQDLQLLQKYWNSRIDRIPAGLIKPNANTVSAIDPSEESENLSGHVPAPGTPDLR